MRYVLARLKEKRDEETYRIYLTDCLYAAVNGGHKMAKRYYDLVHNETVENAVEKDPDEIKSKIVGGLRRLKA